jgi:hypothetical protein
MICSRSRDGKLKRRLAGMVVCSLSWWRGEWVGFTMGVALQPIVSRLLLPDALVTSNPSLIPSDASPDHLGTASLCGRNTLLNTFGGCDRHVEEETHRGSTHSAFVSLFETIIPRIIIRGINVQLIVQRTGK